MNHTLLSTQEVASMINVTETTIKRWSDTGKLPCAKTHGGHRKFNIKDIVEFAETFGYPLAGTAPPPLPEKQMEQLQLGIITKSYKKISDIVFDVSLRGNKNELYQLLLYLYRHHITLAIIADEILRPALVRIGLLWNEGKLEVNQEHRASQAIIESLVRFAPEMYHKKRNGYTVACACPENEYHEIGLRSLSYVLESDGWNIVFLGSNTPFDTLHSFIKTMKPDVLCLSFTLQRNNPEFFEQMKSLGKLVHSYKGRFIVGGFYSSNYTESDFDCDCIAGSATDALAFLKEAFHLKPGPRKSTDMVQI